MNQTTKILLLSFAAGLLIYTAMGYSNDVQFDYYKFSFEFLGAVCQNRQCKDMDLGNLTNYAVNMHGFWPQKYSGSIDFCLYNSYDESKFNSDILEKLNENWVGAYNPTLTFRNHEWGKHGTCWAQQYYQNNTKFLKDDNYYELMNEYFDMVMKIKEEANLEAFFFGDESNFENKMDFDDLQELVAENYQVNKMDLVCETINGEQYLTEARFCLDLDYNYIDCPHPDISCQPGSVIIQAFKRN